MSQAPAEKAMESSLVSVEEDESYTSAAECAWLAPSDPVRAYHTSSDEDEMSKSLDASNEACCLLPEENDMSSPPAVFDKHYQAPDPPDKDMWNMCLRVNVDQRGQPYVCSDFKNGLMKLGLEHEIVGIGPLAFGKTWLVKLKTAEAVQTLANAKSIQVKGWYCAIRDPRKREIVVEVHWVPFNIPSGAMKQVFQKFGEVRKVARQEWSPIGLTVETTTRYVYLTLNVGVRVEDLPYLYDYNDRIQFLIIARGRPPLCLQCGTKRLLWETRCSSSNERCDGTRAPLDARVDGQVAMKCGKHEQPRNCTG